MTALVVLGLEEGGPAHNAGGNNASSEIYVWRRYSIYDSASIRAISINEMKLLNLTGEESDVTARARLIKNY